MQKCCLVGCNNNAWQGVSDYCETHYLEKQEQGNLRVQSPHKVIYLQYDPEACDEITWCQDQIDSKDTTYWRDDVVSELAEAQKEHHIFSCHWCPKGNGGSCDDYSSSKRLVFCCECKSCQRAREILNYKPE